MKVFVTDAAGFVGRHVVGELADRGHHVLGLVRDESEAKTVRSAGGKPVVGDLLEGGKWCNEIRTSDKVISLEEPYELVDGMYEFSQESAKRYGESVTNLIKAASDGSAKSLILTYSTTCFGHREGKWVEGDPGAITPTGLCSPVQCWIDPIEDFANSSQLDIVRVFPGLVYGDGGWLRKLVDEYTAGNVIMAKPKDAYLNLIHVEDLAGMYADIIDKVEGGDSFILTDDRPVTQENLMAYIADLMGLPCPTDVEKEDYEKVFGSLLGETMVSSVRASSIKTIDRLGTKLKYRSFEHGMLMTLESMGIKLREPVRSDVKAA